MASEEAFGCFQDVDTRLSNSPVRMQAARGLWGPFPTFLAGRGDIVEIHGACSAHGRVLRGTVDCLVAILGPGQAGLVGVDNSCHEAPRAAEEPLCSILLLLSSGSPPS